ncbi:MAG: saccharopine dehydrogenase NADP-binding domain-containing protein [Deltaproteobacteria bacterium]|nr:saccharopine dehydrogenase NADP-binding domain-containing protein [Deltaproteobacteria bacterium]
MTYKALVLGGGRVGAIIAADLAWDGDFEVTLADIRGDALRPTLPAALRVVAADLSSPKTIRKLATDHEIVLGALPSAMGLMAMEAVIEAGRNYCDISFMEEDPRHLGERAKEAGLTVIYDCGVAPGMSNLLAGYGSAQLLRAKRVVIYVGGLPRERRWPYEYKAGFAPLDVIEEYTRPARFVLDGKEVEREALSEPELIDFPGVGTLEVFNTDGLRSLLDTLDAPDRIEKTMRYPGHIELMRVLRHAGLFSKEALEVRSVSGEKVKVRPLDVLAELLFPQWTFAPGEEDLTVMRVMVEGIGADEKSHHFQWDLLDRYDTERGHTSMARTTGFPAAIIARMIARGELTRPGVHPPEALATQPNLVDHLLSELKARGVVFKASTDK